MANLDFPYFAFAKDRMVPRVLDKHRIDRAADAKLLAAYRKVNAREDNKCQVTGVTLTPNSRNPKTLREHHHIKGRNLKPEWVTDPKRIILVSRHIHEFLTGNVLLVIGTDARTCRFSWNRNLVKPSKEPFRLRAEKAVA